MPYVKYYLNLRQSRVEQAHLWFVLQIENLDPMVRFDSQDNPIIVLWDFQNSLNVIINTRTEEVLDVKTTVKIYNRYRRRLS